MKSKFFKALKKHQGAFDVTLSEENIAQLEHFYRGVLKYNDILHLVGRCDAEEFAIRHILESIYALQYVAENSEFADIGSGAGLPAIPCLIVRPDLKGILIESKKNKSGFLEKAVVECGLGGRARVINQQFDEVPDQDVTHVFCRALDGFAKKIPRILKWSKSADLVLFAGEAVRNALKKSGVKFDEKLIPLSERRFLFHIRRDGEKPVGSADPVDETAAG